MSRNPLPSSSSKYKISSPQPFVSSELRGAYNTDQGPYPTFPTQSQQTYSVPGGNFRGDAPSSAYPATSSGGASAQSQRQNGGAGESSRNVPSASTSTSGPGGSPARPARSRMRDAPQPPSIPPAGPPSSGRRGELRPIQTSRRPSGSGGLNGNNNAYDIPVSPVTPISPAAPAPGSAPQGNGLFSDPFAGDRAQRSELRAQASAAAREAQQPFQGGPATDKLRNVVGAFMSASRKEEQPAARRPGRSEARDRLKKTPKEEIWEVSAEGGRFGEIDSVLKKIRKDWPFVLESDFSPSTLALSLLSQAPSSSLPTHPSLSSFMRLHESLSTALQAAVQAHFQSFAASLPAHASFLSTLGRAQEQVRKSKEALKDARDGFAGKGKSELAGIRARERMVRDMLKILDTIDHLKQVPDQLESLIGDKRFLQAALILVRSLKTINKPEIAEIGAVSDLRAYFISQETTLTEILVEELHNHIYLKTFYSDSRWKAYTVGQQRLPVIGSQNDDQSMMGSIETVSLPPINGEGNAVPGPGPSSRFSRYLSNLSAKPSLDPSLDFSENGTPSTAIAHVRSGSNALGQAGSHTSLSSLAGGGAQGLGMSDGGNPEADSYAYIEMLLEALAAMGRLGSALDMVAQRVAGEIHTLVESTLDEVEERSEQRREEASARPQSLLFGASDLTTSSRRDSTLRSRPKSLFAPGETLKIEVSLGAVGPPRHAAVLRDLFWTLYSKLAAVLEAHRVVYEVSRWISSRRDFKDASATKASTALNIPVLEVWKPVQQEVRTLLHNYLTDESQSTLDRHQIMSINEVLRDGKVARDKQKQMFKFGDTDSRGVQNEIKLVDDSIQQALKASVPGLVGMQAGEPVNLNNPMMTESDDRYSSAGRHRTLIPPNAFNVSTLFQPTLSFIQRAAAIVPPGFEQETGAFSTVLEDFVVKVFLPQLDEKVTASFQQAVSGYDAYQVDRRTCQDLVHPPLKSSVRVMALIHSLCVMLQTTPFHRENYSRLIVGVIVQYYQQCSARFKELALISSTLDNPEQPLALPAVWAQREDVISTLSELRQVPAMDKSSIAAVGQKEIKLELELLADQPLVESRLINSHRKLEALGNLSQSLRWFIDSLLDLQSVADEPLSPDDENAFEADFPIAVPVTSASINDGTPQLPLTRAMAQRYQAIVQTYEQLAEMVLNTMRLEIRCRVICNLGASLRKDDFRLESEAFEPDPDVLDLNTSLMDSEEVIERTISSPDHSFLFRGLGQLVDHLFITFSSRYIKVVNPAGVRKIKRNILALQQTLRGIGTASEEGVLNRAVDYWDLYERGPRAMLEDLKAQTSKPPYAFDDYNAMLNLQCKDTAAPTSKIEKEKGSRASTGADASSELNGYLIDLHALSMSVEGWEIGGE